MDRKIYWGVSYGHHDAALAVVQGNQILYGSHAERYSRKKNDPEIHADQIREALSFGIPDKVFYYESPFLKSKRHLLSGEWNKLFTHKKLTGYKTINGNHHRSHASAGYYTSGFENAIVVNCDAIGEMETLTVYEARNNILEKRPVYALHYPDSVGLFYSAITKAVGLKPNEEEFILMGMSAFGKPLHLDEVNKWIRISDNGFPVWESEKEFHFGLDLGNLSQEDKMNWAATAQAKVEEYLLRVFQFLVKEYPENKNWVFMGGVALNCVLNSKIASSLPIGSNLHIFPSPGDSGSALGAVLGGLNRHVNFTHSYLGSLVENELSAEAIVQELLTNGIVGVVSGRAEFGPRALGNRSLLADPRHPSMKEKLNKVKMREEFRPFAPVIRIEDLSHFFELPQNITSSPYMQFVMKVKTPELLPAITHVDGTARVQSLTKETNPLLYQVLELWKQKTGCPALVNTSLNIKGEPLINGPEEAIKFEERYGIKVLY